VTHKFSRAFILVACSAAISMLPVSAIPLSTLLGPPPVPFASGPLTFTFTGYNDVVSCTEGINVVACNPSDFAPVNPALINVADADGGSSLVTPPVPGFVLQGTFLAQSYYDTTTGEWVSVDNDITLNYTVTASSAIIDDVVLDVSGNVLVPNDGSEPPSITVGETGNDGLNLQVTDPPPLTLDVADLTTPTASLTVTKDITLISGAGEVCANGVVSEAAPTAGCGAF
jgi:hypothetical protein